MIIINKNPILTSITTFFLIVLVLPWVCFITQAQTDTAFKPTDNFDIPALNSTISFATGGTYERASLENNAWKFVNLRLNNTGPLQNLTVSAQDSVVRITTYQRFNTSVTAARLRYTVVGLGKQAFNFGFVVKEGGWSVVLNGRFMAENEGYQVAPDRTITVTGATANASISYFNLDALGGTADNPNLPFYQKHSVAIATGVVVTVAIFLTVIIRRRTQDGKQG